MLCSKYRGTAIIKQTDLHLWLGMLRREINDDSKNVPSVRDNLGKAVSIFNRMVWRMTGKNSQWYKKSLYIIKILWSVTQEDLSDQDWEESSVINDDQSLVLDATSIQKQRQILTLNVTLFTGCCLVWVCCFALVISLVRKTSFVYCKKHLFYFWIPKTNRNW